MKTNYETILSSMYVVTGIDEYDLSNQEILLGSVLLDQVRDMIQVSRDDNSKQTQETVALLVEDILTGERDGIHITKLDSASEHKHLFN